MENTQELMNKLRAYLTNELDVIAKHIVNLYGKHTAIFIEYISLNNIDIYISKRFGIDNQTFYPIADKKLYCSIDIKSYITNTHNRPLQVGLTIHTVAKEFIKNYINLLL